MSDLKADLTRYDEARRGWRLKPLPSDFRDAADALREALVEARAELVILREGHEAHRIAAEAADRLQAERDEARRLAEEMRQKWLMTCPDAGLREDALRHTPLPWESSASTAQEER